MSAYTPPMRIPLMSACSKIAIGRRPERGQWPAHAVRLLAPAGEGVYRFLRSELGRIERLVNAVLNLFHEHLVLVLVRIALVVGERDLTHDAVPLAALQKVACSGRIAPRFRRGLGHDH